MDKVKDSNILDIVKMYIEELQKEIHIKKVILFGSFAKHNSHEYSDIDIAIVSDDFTGNIEEDFLLLMRATRNVDLRIEPHPFLCEEFEKDPFAEEIQKTGIEVFAA